VIGLLLVLVFAVTLYAAARRISPTGTSAIVAVIMAGYAARLILSLFLREVPLFSHGLGGDSAGYEQEGLTIARLWTYQHVHYVTADEFPDLGRTALPANLFALVAYLNGGRSQLGCTAIIACLSCLNIFALALESGASYRTARIVCATLIFLPSFVFYTSDTYKDGIVQFCVVAIVGSALRLSRAFSFRHLILATICVAALAETRAYLVYATIMPLGFGILGFRSKSRVRTFVSIAALSMGVLALVGLTRASETLVDDASTTFQRGTSREALQANAEGGSGVQVEGSAPTAFAQQLAYTLFAPFFWQGGSLGFQLAKIDGLVWYVIAFLAVKGAIQLSRRNRSELLILASFIVPTTFAYAAAFSNVGLTVRERLGVVMVCALLAAMGAASTVVDQAKSDLPIREGLLRPRIGQ
jgi:hypothetical protein